jgi:hypothetical protein
MRITHTSRYGYFYVEVNIIYAYLEATKQTNKKVYGYSNRSIFIRSRLGYKARKKAFRIYYYFWGVSGIQLLSHM